MSQDRILGLRKIAFRPHLSTAVQEEHGWTGMDIAV